MYRAQSNSFIGGGELVFSLTKELWTGFILNSDWKISFRMIGLRFDVSGNDILQVKFE